MADLKWADVAHYYLPSRIYMKNVGKSIEFHPGWVAKDIMDLVLLDRGDIQLMPILRHLEDMTEGEALEWFKFIHGDDGGAYSAHGALVWAKDIIRSGRYTPTDLVWIISKGLDVFGLIESGQAIRKESQPVEAQQ